MAQRLLEKEKIEGPEFEELYVNDGVLPAGSAFAGGAVATASASSSDSAEVESASEASEASETSETSETSASEASSDEGFVPVSADSESADLDEYIKEINESADAVVEEDKKDEEE